jgi:hypothetical protein
MKNLISTVILTAALCTHRSSYTLPNFELISADPSIPIYVQANGGPWQTLDQKHYRFPVEVPENMLLIVSLSANEDKSAPTSLIFAPERALDVAKEIGENIHEAPTFYVSARVSLQEIPEKNVTIKRVILNPQTSPSHNNKTKSGLPLDNNVTQQMIDHIVQASSPDQQEIIKQVAAVNSCQHNTQAKDIEHINEHALVQSTKSTVHTQRTSINPKNPTGTLQHTDTPQRIEATLKNISSLYRQADAKWQAMRDYLTKTKTPITTHKNDPDLYKELIEYYQTCADRAKSALRKTYLNIIEIIKNTYMAAH